MRKVVRIVALVFAVALAAAACSGDADPETDSGSDTETGSDAGTDDAADPGQADFDLEGREIKVAVENAYLPFNYIDAETGEPGGWDYAALADICGRINCVAKYETFDWDPMIQAISDGQFDVAADGITITDERAEVVDFSDGYINIEQRLLVSSENSEIDSVDALKASDCRVATQTGTTNYDTAVDLVGENRVSALDEFGFAVQSVISGDACAVVIDETAGQGYVGENADDLKLVGDSLSSGQLGFIFPKGSDLVAPFNQAIAEMKADGTMEKLGKEYFSDAFTITYEDIEG